MGATRIADKLTHLRPSLTLALKEQAGKRRAEGLPVYDFGLGETKGDLAPALKQGGLEAFQLERTSYMDSAGIPELRDAVLDWLNVRDSYFTDNVVVGCGAKQCLLNTFLAVCNPGDVALINPTPWVSYIPIAHCASVESVIVDPAGGVANNFKVSAQDLEQSLSEHPNAKLFLLNSPNNPTGQIYTQEEIDSLLEVCVRNQIYFVLDRLYWKTVFDGKAFPEPKITEDSKPWLIQIDGLSKAFRRAGGLRVGWSLAPTDVSKAMRNLQSHHSSGTAVTSQYAALNAITQNFDPEMIEFLEQQRSTMRKMTSEIPHLKTFPTEGAFYSFWDVREVFGKKTPNGKVLSNSDDVSEYLIAEAGVITCSGTSFYADGFLRVCFHVSKKELEEGLAAAKGAFSKL